MPGDVGDHVAAPRGGVAVDQLGDDVDARRAHPLGGPRGERARHQAAQPVMLGAVEADEQTADPVPHRTGGDALDHQADALRHGEPGIAQHGAHQVVGE